MNVKTFIDRPVLSIVISVFIVLLGIISLLNLPIEKYPDIAPPTVVVMAQYPGASADAIQKSVVVPLEEAINGVENMIYMTSSASNSGVAEISVYFRQGTDADMAQVNVQNRVAQATGMLPAEVTRIGLTTYKKQPSMLRTFTLYSPNSTYDEDFIANYINIHIKPEMLRIKGVGTVVVMGGDYSMRIWLDPAKMAQYGLVPSDITALLAEQNIEAATGSFGENYDQTFHYAMKYRGRRVTEEEFGDIVVQTLPSGENLKLKDIARISLGLNNYNYKGATNGCPGIGNLVFQTAGSNATQINKDIDKLFEQVQADLPADLVLMTLEDSNDFLFASIKNVVVSLLIAILLVFLVVYFFLQDFRATLVPTIGIIVSLIGTFAFIQVAGFTLNLLTLFALVLVIGTVVDNSIVVVEAVQARFDAGYKSAYQATVDAMGGLTAALFTTTLVFMAVFIPVSFMGGTTGVFYKQFGLTMAVAVGISFVSALTLSPALCAIMLKPNPEEGEGSRVAQRVRTAYQVSYRTLMKRYTSAAMFFIRRRWLVWGTIVLTIALLVYFLQTTKTGLVPDEDTGILMVDISTPVGSGVNQTNHIVHRIDSCVRLIPEVQAVNAVSGEGIISGTGTNMGMLIVKLRPWEERTHKGQDNKSVMNKIYAMTAEIKDASLFVLAPSMIPGYGTGGGFEFHVQDKVGGSVQDMFAIVQNYLNALRQRQEIAAAYSSYNIDYPMYMVDVDASRCKRAGVSPAEVLSCLGGYYGGIYASNFNRFTKVYRVMIQASPELVHDQSSLNNVFVRLHNGEMSPISQYITLQKVYDPLVLKRFNLYTSIGVNGNIAPGYSSGDAIRAIKEVAAETLPRGYSIDFSGITREEEQTGSGNTAFIFIICIVFIYLVMAALYESFFIPFAVILSVPFGLMGSFLFARMLGLENNIYLQVGLIMLIGLLAKTAILLTEYASQCRNAGMSLKQSAFFAAKMRMRPILMTALTMVFGMLPLMFATGVGANGNRTIGAGAVGGELIGTLALLFIVPALFVIFQGLQEKVKPIREFTPSDDPLIQQELKNIEEYSRQKAMGGATVCVVAMLTLSLSSCGIYGKYKPVTTLDSSLYGDTLQHDTSAVMANLSWREVFTDTLLQDLIDTALVRNLDLRISHEHVEQAKAGLLGAKLAYLPSIQLVPEGAFSPQYGVRQGQYDLLASASWEIDIFGRTLNSMRGAKAAKAMTEDYEQAARCGLIAGVASTYYTLLMLDEQLQVAQQTEMTWGKTVQTIRRMKEAGMANEAAVSQMDATYFAIQTMVLDLNQSIREVENALNLLLARPGSTSIRRSTLALTAELSPFSSSVEDSASMLLPEIGIPVQMLYNRPDVRAAQQAMAKAHYARQLATSNCLPKLTLSGLFGWTNYNYNTPLDPMTMISTLTAGLFVPIFQSGRNIAQVRAAKSQLEESRMNFTKVVLAAGNEVNEALVDYQTSRRKSHLYDQQVEALSRAREATELLMRYGSTTYLDVLTAQNALLNAQFTRIANLAQEQHATVALYHALGGGRAK